MTTEPRGRRAVLFDVDGTLLDVIENQRRVWRAWAARHGLDADEVYATALRTKPTETFAAVAPDLAAKPCLAVLHELEDADARTGDYAAFPGAAELLNALAEKRWGVVTSNYAHRVQMRFERTGLPLPAVIVDADAVARGKPHPEGYLAAADALGVHPRDCLVIEDGLTGVEAARRAGMTVWAVNVPAISAAAESADSHYPTIDSARARILQWLDGSVPL